MEVDGKDNNGKLLSILQDTQSQHGYLPEDKLREIAMELKIPLTDVYGVATFYKSFSLKPRGRHHVKVCLGTACHVRGSSRVVKESRDKLGIEPGETSENGEYSLETVMCLGCCAIGPVVVKDGKYYGQVTPARVDSILKTTRE